jgi:hypothetical protein
VHLRILTFPFPTQIPSTDVKLRPGPFYGRDCAEEVLISKWRFISPVSTRFLSYGWQISIEDLGYPVYVNLYMSIGNGINLLEVGLFR